MRKPTRQFNSAFRKQYKTALNYLAQIDTVRAEIDYVNEQIHRLKERAYSVKTSNTETVISGGKKNEAIINYLAKLEKYNTLIANKKSKLLDKIAEIEATLDKLYYPQGWMLKLYYLQNYNYERIAVKTFYSYKAVQHFIRKGVVELQEILNKSQIMWYIKTTLKGGFLFVPLIATKNML